MSVNRAPEGIVDHLLANRYRLLDRLGTGGMSVVWRAHDQVLDREVAVKVLSPDMAATPNLLDRIRVEARSAARLRHPNVVKVHDYGETTDRRPYVVMELVDGRSLADVLTRGALPWRSAVLVCAQVAAALAGAHAHGIVHRDVKPSNVMVTSDGVKLVDFGISATIGEADVIGGEVYGTPAYLAPERLGGGTVRPATDVYALGLLLYLTLAGRMPWEASTTTQMLKAHRYLEPAGLPSVPGLPREVTGLLRRCLAKRPADRPSAAQAAGVLADVAGIAPARPLLATLEAPTEVLPVRSRRPLVAAAAAALVLVAGGAAWLGGRPGSSEVAALTEVPAAAAVPPGLACAVGYAIRSASNGRLSTAVTISNTGPGSAADWHLTFVLPDGQRLMRGWSQRWTQDGQSLQVRGTGLAAGAQVSTGFDASYRQATTLPGQFRLNGTVCESQMSVAVATTATGTTTTKAKPAAPAAKVAKVKGKGSSGKGSSGKHSSGKGKN